MPTRLTRLSLTPARLNRLAAGLTLAAASASPALAAGPQGTPEGVVRFADRPTDVTLVAAEDPAVRTWSGPEQIVPGSERVVGDPTAGVPSPGVSSPGVSSPGVSSHGAHSHGASYGAASGSTVFVEKNPEDRRPNRGAIHPHHGGLHGPGGRRTGLLGLGVHRDDLSPARLPFYDNYLPPDDGWQEPVAYPVQREVYRYNNWYPEQWYGLPGSQKPRVAPHVFMPTDTTQLGYYYQQVPTWQPASPASFPAPPDPRTLHHFTPPGGPAIADYPGVYPGEPRVHYTYDPVTGQRIEGGTQSYGGVQSFGGAQSDRGTVVNQPAPSADGSITVDPSEGAPAPPEPRMQVDPLPSSTEPTLDSEALPGAPVPDDAVLPPENEV